MKAATFRSAIGVTLLATILFGVTGCAPTEHAGLLIDPQALTCHVDAEQRDSVLQIPIVAEPRLEFTPDILRVELDEPQNVAVAGIDLVFEASPYGPSEPVPTEEIDRMKAARDNAMLFLPVPRVGSATLVLLLETEQKDDTGSFDSLRVFWGGGEPIYWQTVDVSARVGSDCALSL